MADPAPYRFRGRASRCQSGVFTHNDRIEIAKEGLHLAVRFGDREAWPWLEADPLIAVPLTHLCALALLPRLRQPGDLAAQRLLRSYRTDEW